MAAKVFAKPTSSSSASSIKPADLKRIAVRARESRMAIDPIAIQQVSSDLFVNIDQPKWEAATGLVNLRSFVNSTLSQAKQNIVNSMGPRDQVLQYVGMPGKWIEVHDLSLVLDGKPGETNIFSDHGRPVDRFSYFIFRKCKIVYRGGKVWLVNVFFDNCTFEISDSEKGHLFAKAILQDTFIKFSSAD